MIDSLQVEALNEIAGELHRIRYALLSIYIALIMLMVFKDMSGGSHLKRIADAMKRGAK